MANAQKFCKRREVEKMLNSLVGIMQGIEADAEINAEEKEELLNWVAVQADLATVSPIDEIVASLQDALADNVLTREEYDDILYACENYIDYHSSCDYEAVLTQRLHGFVHGLLADGKLNTTEIKKLSAWLEGNDDLTGTYPYDEIRALTATILADGKITKDEHDMLLSYLANFVDTTVSMHLFAPELEAMREKYHISAICAKAPKVEIPAHVICFTGESDHCPRKEIQIRIEEAGGIFTNSVSKKVQYLVVGSKGNPYWMYTCYGRKVEKAAELRKAGSPIQIIAEADFWAVLEG